MSRRAKAPAAPLRLTNWIAAATLPVRVGVYEVDEHFGTTWYAYWDGSKFGYLCLNPQAAYDARHKSTDCHPLVGWRGVRRWVLTVPNASARDGIVYFAYRRNGVPRWYCSLSKAKGFNSRDEALAFGQCLVSALYPIVTAVLP